ncbi:S24 family peptidase [Ensifer sp. MJa1]|uniref:S24 family peptidase n=1 Tax=Ensifer sp. MJa1 TaxID=2919888 RepID=UPI0030082CF3
MLSHGTIWHAIDALAERHQLSPSGLARRAGLDPTSFNKSKRHSADGRERWPSTESIAKVLEATGATIDQFASLLRPDRTPADAAEQVPPAAAIPLIGFAQAGAGGFFDDGGFPAGQGWDVIDFPNASSQQQSGIYALEVQGDSMLPLYRDGDILIVDPGAQVRRGDRVVVKTRDGEVMAKILTRQTPQMIELLSLNPEHPNRSFEISQVEWIARIIWASQ